MLSIEELADLPPRQYLERFNVEFYLRDIVCLFLARRRGDTRSPPEFISQYLETVLRGEHVLQRGFRYVNSTPVNRRAFVLMLRQGLRGVSSPETTALTTHDFHDLVSHVCSDFPLAIVAEAARHAKAADPRRHHLLGESTPFGTSIPLADSSKGAAGGGHVLDSSALLVFSSLQRLVEFCLVYAEILGALKHIYREEPGCWPPRAGAEEGGGSQCLGPAPSRDGGSASSEAVRWPRAQLVSELRYYGGALTGAALPSERALRRLQRPAEGAPAGSAAVGFAEALAEMAEHFELGLEAYPEDLVGRVDLLSSESPSTCAAEPSAASVPTARSVAAGASGDRRRRERSLKAKGRG